MNKEFWILIEKQWRQVVSADLIANACKDVTNDVKSIEKIQQVKNIWECLDDEEDDDDDF